MSKLPKGWLQVAFEDVAEINPRKSVDLERDESVTFVPMAAVNEVSGTIVEGVSRPLHEVNQGYTQFANGDVIFAKITPSMENGKSAVAIGLENGIGFGSTEFHVLRSRGAVLPEYLWRFVRQKAFREDAQKVMSGAVGQQRVPADYLKSHQLPLPPLPEQKRIVAKIDTLTNCTARAQTDLDCIPALAEKYKRRLLAEAFSGGQRPTIKTIAANKNAPFLELATLCVSLTDGDHQAPPRVDEGIPFITISTINSGKIELEKAIRFVPQEYYENLKPARKPEKGDVLFSVTGTVGIPALVRETVPFVFQRHIAILRPNPKIILSEYLAHILSAPQVMEQVLATATGTAQLTVPLGELRKFKIPVPPLSEQTKIVHRIETAFGWLERMTAHYAAANKLVPQLDAAILIKAFRGKLVSQDQSDESASKLLERITVQRETVREEPKRRLRSDRWLTTIKRKPAMANLIEVLNSNDGWILASEVAQKLGIGDGSTSDAVEEFYHDLRLRVLEGSVEVERRGDEDWLKLRPSKAG
tara:strand:- start:4156 stop:5745 length:1590 start_codon:yes stop_codon:yes gene_type:complete